MLVGSRPGPSTSRTPKAVMQTWEGNLAAPDSAGFRPCTPPQAGTGGRSLTPRRRSWHRAGVRACNQESLQRQPLHQQGPPERLGVLRKRTVRSSPELWKRLGNQHPPRIRPSASGLPRDPTSGHQEKPSTDPGLSFAPESSCSFSVSKYKANTKEFLRRKFSHFGCLVVY